MRSIKDSATQMSFSQCSWQRDLRARKVGMGRSLKLNLFMNWWHDLSYHCIASTSEIQCLPQPIKHHFQPCQKNIIRFRSQQHLLVVSSVNIQFLWLQYPLNKHTSKERCAFLHIFQGPCSSESRCQLKGNEAGPWVPHMGKPAEETMKPTDYKPKAWALRLLFTLLIWEPGSTNNRVQQHPAVSWYENVITVQKGDNSWHVMLYDIFLCENTWLCNEYIWNK